MPGVYEEEHFDIHPLDDRHCTCLCMKCYSRLNTALPTGVLCICEECPCEGTHD